MEIDKIKCTEIGIGRLKEIVAQYNISDAATEKEWINNKNYEKLFFHNLVYPYGVARKYYFHWIPKEETIDISIEGFKNGLSKYLESVKDFRVGEYVVWWSMQSCIGHFSKKIWALSIPLQNRNLPPNELAKLVHEHKEGDQKSIEILKKHYQFLFEIIDSKYSDVSINTSEAEKLDVIACAIHRTFSMSEFMEEEYDDFRNEYEFEDIVLLEYCLIYEDKMKIANQ